MQRVFALIRRLWTDSYVRTSAGFFLASMGVAVLNYAFHPVVSRLLSLRDFGDVQALFSLSTQLTTILGAFTLATVHASVNYHEPGEAEAVVRALRRSALAIVTVFIAVLVLGAEHFSAALQFTSPSLFFALACFLITTVLYSIQTGKLQGSGRFFQLSLAQSLVAGGRIVFASGLILLGWRAFGAMIGIVLAQVMALGYVLFMAQRAKTAVPVASFTLSRKRFVRELGYVVLVGVSMAYITALYTVDVLIVKRLFPPDIAGLYAGISTVAKIIIFSTSPFAAVLLSSIKRQDEPAVRRRVFLKSLALIGAVGGGAMLVFAVIPSFVIKTLIGTKYVSQAPLLPWLALAYVGVAVANVSFYLGLALKRRRLLFLVLVGSVVLLVSTALSHETLLDVVKNLCLTGLVAGGSSLLFAFREIRDRSTYG
jgi:O-antigen/teichoic acid export membrane protein